jgi:outer membrane protein assembly factor BamA
MKREAVHYSGPVAVLLLAAALLLPLAAAGQPPSAADEPLPDPYAEDPTPTEIEQPTAEEETEEEEAEEEEEEAEAEEAEVEEPVVRWVEEPTEPVLPEGIVADPAEGPSGPRYALEKIVIRGNNKTLRAVILRLVEIEPGAVFPADDPRLEAARYRLLATGWFYDVQLSLKRGDRRGWVVLVIDVKERNTIVIRDFVIGLSEITPYGSLGVADRSFLGSGVRAAASAVVSKEQWGYRLELADDHFLNSDFGIHVQGQFAHARDFFGHSSIRVSTSEGEESKPYAVMYYDRAGIILGSGYNLLVDYFFTLDYRFETIRADVPAAGSHHSFGERRPIEFGHLLPGPSYVSSLILGLSRDTRDHPLLPSEGAFTELAVELSTEVLGSDYEFSKFSLTHDTHFPLGRRHSIRLGLFAGFIMGDAPFFDQFFVGDFSAFIPSRVLGLNFAHLHPSLLDTSVQEMRYEDLAGSINLEYSIPFYRGHGFFYGVNGFVGVGLFAIASREDLRTDPQGYQGYEVVPMDLTADLGIKVDTEIGVLVLSLGNLFRLIPRVGKEAAE